MSESISEDQEAELYQAADEAIRAYVNSLGGYCVGWTLAAKSVSPEEPGGMGFLTLWSPGVDIDNRIAWTRMALMRHERAFDAEEVDFGDEDE